MATATEAEATAILKKHWGHDAFRESQASVIEAALSGRDVLAVLPTGYGKSAAFQIPALIKDGCAIVISPLIALMKDQVDDCHKRGIKASYVNSHVDEDEIVERLDSLEDGDYDIFYVAPERIRNRNFMEALRIADINFLVVDEAHCASRWGHDFRPMYSRIKEIVKALGDAPGRPPIIAVTATATKDIEDDIARSVGMADDYLRIVADPIRPNLSYQVMHGSPWSNLHTCVRRFDTRGGRYIIYVGTRNGSEKVAEIVGEDLGDPDVIGFYHAGMTKEERERVQDAFKDGQLPIIVATCAFGMGIDVPNIRAVIHFGIPGSLEDYIQEAGRAGRDGDHSDVVLMFDDYSVDLRRRFLDAANPPYELFLDVWAWLGAKLEDGETLTLSAAKIADSMNSHFKRQADGRAVNGVLNTMESYGLVRRRYMRGGTTVAFNPRDLKIVIDAEPPLSERTQRVAVALWEETAGERNRDMVKITVDRGTFAEQCDVSELGLMRAFKKLQELGTLGIAPSFGGKSTQIVNKHYRKDIDAILPKDQIVAKRRREQKRLAEMIGYADTPDTIRYIRRYFGYGDAEGV